MIRYIKCPRCELNYIDGDKQEYCDVCIAEIKGNKLAFADLEDEILEEEMESEGGELCPVCGINHIRFGETMCEACKKQAEADGDEEIDPEQDEEWKNYLNDDADELILDDPQLDEELKEELEGEEEEEEEYEDEMDEDDFFEDDLDGDFDDDYDDDDDEEDEDDDLF